MSFLNIKEEVREAIAEGKPVLALESTIISHGMPFPENYETALRLENIARELDVVPATICSMNGEIKIGISAAELELLASSKAVIKVSGRDFGKVLTGKKTGATTVAATMIAARLAGIKVFATGGIGGVHRFAAETYDISADLIELSRTPVIVVTAGAKAILDLPKTLEFLETFGVPVYGFRTDHFPAFYTADSGLKIDRIDAVSEIIEIFITNQQLGFQSGMIVANPIPQRDEIPSSEMEEYIEEAIFKAKKNEISGKALTPFLLAEIVKLSDGKALTANLKLVENNVKLGCKIAWEFADRSGRIK